MITTSYVWQESVVSLTQCDASAFFKTSTDQTEMLWRLENLSVTA
jgi:hypothetical protein